MEQAWQLLATKKIAQAPVLDAQGIVVGLLLRVRIWRRWRCCPSPARCARRLPWPSARSARCMITPVPAVAEDTDLRRVTHVPLETGLPGLPVTDDLGHLSWLYQPHRYLARRGQRPTAGFVELSCPTLLPSTYA